MIELSVALFLPIRQYGLTMNNHNDQGKSQSAIGVFVKSATTAMRGLVDASLNDRAVRRLVITLFVLTPAAAVLPVTRIEQLLLILSIMLVVAAELFNSAIERTVDRISREMHPDSRAAKDLAAGAVAMAALMCGLTWTCIAGPVLWGVLKVN